jgi:hypothetical protein
VTRQRPDARPRSLVFTVALPLLALLFVGAPLALLALSAFPDRGDTVANLPRALGLAVPIVVSLYLGERLGRWLGDRRG